MDPEHRWNVESIFDITRSGTAVFWGVAWEGTDDGEGGKKRWPQTWVIDSTEFRIDNDEAIDEFFIANPRRRDPRRTDLAALEPMKKWLVKPCKLTVDKRMLFELKDRVCSFQYNLRQVFNDLGRQPPKNLPADPTPAQVLRGRRSMSFSADFRELLRAIFFSKLNGTAKCNKRRITVDITAFDVLVDLCGGSLAVESDYPYVVGPTAEDEGGVKGLVLRMRARDALNGLGESFIHDGSITPVTITWNSARNGHLGRATVRGDAVARGDACFKNAVTACAHVSTSRPGRYVRAKLADWAGLC